MRAHFGLPSVEKEEMEGRPPIGVKFEIPYFTVSGIQVSAVNRCALSLTSVDSPFSCPLARVAFVPQPVSPHLCSRSVPSRSPRHLFTVHPPASRTPFPWPVTPGPPQNHVCLFPHTALFPAVLDRLPLLPLHMPNL